MKLCRFNDDRFGFVESGLVYDVTEALFTLPSRRWAYPPGDPVIANFEGITAAALAVLPRARTLPLSAVRLLSPIANPSKIIGAPVNYRAHLDEANADTAISQGTEVQPIDRAGLFLKAGSALIGPSQPIRLAFPDRRTDHEAEIAVVIGRTGHHIPRARAMDHVAGYCLALDMTVRGSEDRSFRKSCDSYAVLGPWLVTTDELPDPANLAFSLAVNGERRQAGHTSMLIRSIPELIAWASRFYTLHPGDVIMTGTPEGVGPVSDGDVITVEGRGLGSMTISVVG